MKKRDEIIGQSLDLFFKFGIQCITMDDIANKCSVSKKTIYKYFQNKDDLLMHTIKSQVEELKGFLKIISDNSLNSLEELFRLFEYINGVTHVVSPVFIKDLKKYHSNNYIEVFRYKTEIMVPFVINNIRKGKDEELYKSDLDAKEICESFDSITEIIFNYDYSFNSNVNKKALVFLHSLLLYRLVSIKGLKLLNSYYKVN
ncbi:TetR/AcrR family transcriptional regulator [Urechidicola croceus]|uniref:HTH tetR-type domain-containing protein n=1 Tax=Urechidicola croceus TaxID=1850246 RepID=A0A1D8P5A2_9FLAO|nr:TetR/AcrR family transcriptional regulator [Urechidicola croceus]AOW19755.1 hypothetical protein LPB138_03240 [Urechidicola croceus]